MASSGSDSPGALEATAPFVTAASFGSGVGAQIGRYVVKRVVGLGGMGVVVAAQDPELGRMVAIKLVTRDREEARTRLVREAQAMARLSHPNVVTVHEVIRVGGGAGIVMELVEGESLAAWCEAKPRGWRDIVAAYVQAARGLAAAHRAGLVHRDFKPSNALIDRDGVVRVTDFGLVRATNPSGEVAGEDSTLDGASLDLSLTHTGAKVGTPNYMAPEQHRGDPVDARTDQWALACSLYAALYRQRPFAGDNYQQLSVSVLGGAIRPEPSDTRVPRAIRAAIRRALSLEPDDRFATMSDLVAALSPSRRAWQVAALAAGGVIAGAIAIALAIGRDGGATCAGLDAPLAAVWNPTRSAGLRARFASVVGHGDLVAGDRAIAALDRHGAGWLATRTRACTQARQGVGSPELLDRRMRCLDQRLAEMSAVVAALVDGEPSLIRGAGEAVDRLHPVADCDDPRDTAPRPADPRARADIADAEEALARGWALQALGQYERALPLARQAVSVGERTGWTPLLARALILRGECEDRKRDYAAALATFDRAATAAAQAQDDPAVVEALAHSFLVQGEHLGRPAEALAGRRYIEIALERAGRPPRVRAVWLHFLAIMLHRLDRQDEALAVETEAVATWRKIVPAGHTYLLDSLETEGNIQIARGEYALAESLLREVLAGKIAAGGPNHPPTADTLTNLGVLEATRGHLSAAIVYWERARDVTEAAGIEYFLTAYNIGLARYELGRWRAAVDELTIALARAERTAPGPSTQIMLAASGLGAAQLALGETDRAAALLERAIEAGRGAGSPEVAEPLAHASRLASRRGDRTTARARLEEARKLAPTNSWVAIAEADLARGEGCRAAVPAYQRAIAQAVAANQQRGAVDSEATTALAECLLDLGRAAEAASALEPALVWLEDGGAEPAALAQVRFALARALAASGGDRRRARTLAESARSAFAAMGPAVQARAADVDRWLARP